MAEQQLVLIDRDSRLARWTLLAAMVLTGLSMRTAAITVGPVLEEVESGLHVTPAVAGVITTLPVDRKSTRLNSSHLKLSRMPSSA